MTPPRKPGDAERCCFLGCKTKAEMRTAHGTPEEFAQACRRASDMCTDAEANAAILKYVRIYADAPEVVSPSGSGAMTRADADAPDEVWVVIENGGSVDVDRTKEGAEFLQREFGGLDVVRYVKAPKADGGAKGAALSEDDDGDTVEPGYWEAVSDLLTGKTVHRLTQECIRLRARERKLVEQSKLQRAALRSVMPYVERLPDAVSGSVRAALEEP